MNRLDNTAREVCQQPKSIENKKRVGFDSIDRNFWSDSRLTNSAKIVIGEINSYASNYRPSLSTISNKLGMSVNTVRAGVAQGEKYGYVRALRRIGRVTLYSMITPLYVHEERSTLSISDTVTLSISDTHRISNKDKHIHINDVEAVIELPEDTGVNPDIKKKNSSHISRKKRKSRAKAKINYKGLLKTEVGHSMDMSEIVWGGAGSYDWIKANRAMLSMITKHGMAARQWIDDFVGSGKITWRDIKSRSIDQFIYDMDCELNKLAKM